MEKNYNTFTDSQSYNMDDSTDDENGLHQSPYGDFDKRARNVLIISTLLCLLFIIGEIVGGILSGSLAIVTDSSHLLTDLVTYIISIVGLYTSRRAPTTRFTFGWYRIEIMGALISMMLIWLVTGVLIYLATMRLIHSNYEIDGKVMLITACCGVFFNVILLTVLFAYKPGQSRRRRSSTLDSHSHNIESSVKNEHQSEVTFLHSHGHSHDNVNVKSALIHVIADLVQSIGVLIAAYIIYFKPEWKIADPITTYIFGFFVLVTTISFMRTIVNVLMEGSPKNIKHDDVVEFIRKSENVSGVHDVHVWALTTNRSVLSAHVVIDEGIKSTETLQNLNKALKKRFGLDETMIQIEQVDVRRNSSKDCVCE